MVNKRLAALLILVVTSITLVFAVGKKEAETSADSQKIIVWMGSWWDQKAPEIVKKFEADYPNYKLTIECLPINGYFDNAIAATLAGSPPDIIDMDTSQIASMADKKIIMELPDFATKLTATDFGTSAWILSHYEGKMYGVPSRASAGALFYNKKMFDTAKVTYPTANWTWDDFLSAAKKITVPGQQYGGSIAGAKSDPLNVMSSFAPVLWAMGGDFMAPDYSKAVLDSPNSIKAIKYWVELLTKEKVVPEGSVNYTTSRDIIPLFTTNKVAMLISGENSISPFNAVKDLEWGMTLVPGKMSQGGGWTFTIPVTAKNPKGAKLFIEWFIKPENASVLSARQPGNINAYTVAPWNTAEYDILREAAKTSKTLPSFGQWTQAQNIIIDELQILLQGSKNIEQGAKDMTQKINALLKQ